MKHGQGWMVMLLVLGLFFSPAERQKIERHQRSADIPARVSKKDTQPAHGYGELRSPEGTLERWGQRDAPRGEAKWRQAP